MYTKEEVIEKVRGYYWMDEEDFRRENKLFCNRAEMEDIETSLGQLRAHIGLSLFYHPAELSEAFRKYLPDLALACEFYGFALTEEETLAEHAALAEDEAYDREHY